MTETKSTDMTTARKLTRIAQDLQALVGMMALVNISDNEIKSFFVVPPADSGFFAYTSRRWK